MSATKTNGATQGCGLFADILTVSHDVPSVSASTPFRPSLISLSMMFTLKLNYFPLHCVEFFLAVTSQVFTTSLILYYPTSMVHPHCTYSCFYSYTTFAAIVFFYKRRLRLFFIVFFIVCYLAHFHNVLSSAFMFSMTALLPTLGR